MAPRPGDGLSMAGDSARQQHLNVLAQAGVSIQAAGRSEGLHTGKNRVIPGRAGKLNASDAGAIVVFVIAAKDLLIKSQPVLKCMAGGAQSDDRLAGAAILLDALELFAGNRQPAREEHHHITRIQVLQSRQIIVSLAESARAAHIEILFQVFLESAERFIRAVFERSGDKTDLERRPFFPGWGQGRLLERSIVRRGSVALHITEQIADLLFIQIVQNLLGHERFR